MSDALPSRSSGLRDVSRRTGERLHFWCSVTDGHTIEGETRTGSGAYV